jgi:hypothetical protein
MRYHATTRILFAFAFSTALSAQDVREHTRPRAATTVNPSQAEALTLTIGAVTPRVIQTWVRTAGTINEARTLLSADVPGRDAPLIRVGQRARAFPPNAKSSMYQAFVTRVTPHAGGITVEAALKSTGRPEQAFYILEIVVEQGPFLSVPNEAIIEEGSAHIVYVQQGASGYLPQEIRAGIQGELYTQVLDGVQDGDQVVTIGSFFIDAEQKLKGSARVPPLPTSP